MILFESSSSSIPPLPSPLPLEQTENVEVQPSSGLKLLCLYFLDILNIILFNKKKKIKPVIHR